MLYGKMFCLASIGARLSGFVQSAKDIPNMVVIDGCDVNCSRGILAQAQVPLKNYPILANLVIEKNKDFALDQQDIEKGKQAVKELLGEIKCFLHLIKY